MLQNMVFNRDNVCFIKTNHIYLQCDSLIITALVYTPSPHNVSVCLSFYIICLFTWRLSSMYIPKNGIIFATFIFSRHKHLNKVFLDVEHILN